MANTEVAHNDSKPRCSDCGTLIGTLIKPCKCDTVYHSTCLSQKCVDRRSLKCEHCYQHYKHYWPESHITHLAYYMARQMKFILAVIVVYIIILAVVVALQLYMGFDPQFDPQINSQNNTEYNTEFFDALFFVRLVDSMVTSFVIIFCYVFVKLLIRARSYRRLFPGESVENVMFSEQEISGNEEYVDNNGDKRVVKVKRFSHTRIH